MGIRNLDFDDVAGISMRSPRQDFLHWSRFKSDINRVEDTGRAILESDFFENLINGKTAEKSHELRGVVRSHFLLSVIVSGRPLGDSGTDCCPQL